MPATKTLFPWPGGKTRLLPHLLPLVERTLLILAGYQPDKQNLGAREPLRVLGAENGI